MASYRTNYMNLDDIHDVELQSKGILFLRNGKTIQVSKLNHIGGVFVFYSQSDSLHSKIIDRDEISDWLPHSS